MAEYLHIGKDNRVRLITFEDGKCKVKSYPRILMEEILGYPLKPNQDVHHIDGNPLNNDVSNLEVVEHGEHQKMHATKYFDKLISCDVCGKEFLWTGKQESLYQRDLNRGKHRARCCSRTCSYYFSKLGTRSR